MKRKSMKKASEKKTVPFKFSIAEEKGDEVIIEVSPEDYAHEMAMGILPEETLPPGRHTFIRGGLRKRFPNFDPATVKTTVEIHLGLDLEVLEYFKQLAKDTNADSYQSVIKQVLQSAMEQGQKQPLPEQADVLLDNPQFIEAVAERVRRISSKKPAVKKVSPVDKSRRRAA